MFKRKTFQFGAPGLLILLLFGWFIWPTLYYYGKQDGEIWRVNRYTGVKYVATGDGWMSVADLDAQTRARANARSLQDNPDGQDFPASNNSSSNANQAISPTASLDKSAPPNGTRVTNSTGTYKRLPGVTIGSRRLRASLSIMYDESNACMRYRFSLSPYVENLLDTASVTVMFQNEGGFTVQTERLSIGSFLKVTPDGKKFTEYQQEGKIFMTAEEYAGIQAFSCSWQGI